MDTHCSDGNAAVSLHYIRGDAGLLGLNITPLFLAHFPSLSGPHRQLESSRTICLQVLHREGTRIILVWRTNLSYFTYYHSSFSIL